MPLDEFTQTPRVAYFSMEIALRDEIPMKGAISKNTSYFHSHRMMRRYGTDLNSP